jgi:hypothetical protein
MTNKLKKIIMSEFGQSSKKFADSRDQSKTKFTRLDSLKSAFAVFYFQSPSWLEFQKNNGGLSLKLFGIKKIPLDEQIKESLDGQDVRLLKPAFEKIFRTIDLEPFQERQTSCSNRWNTIFQFKEN